jgi:hypothetical protein
MLDNYTLSGISNGTGRPVTLSRGQAVFIKKQKPQRIIAAAFSFRKNIFQAFLRHQVFG